MVKQTYIQPYMQAGRQICCVTVKRKGQEEEKKEEEI
jgi:hypothetical protein